MSIELNARILLELVTLGMPEPYGADVDGVAPDGMRIVPGVKIHAKTAADVAEWAQRFEVGITVAEVDHRGVKVWASFPLEGEWIEVFTRPAYSAIAETLSRNGFGFDLSEPVEVDAKFFLPKAVAS